MSEQARILGGALTLVVLILAAQGLVDRVELDTEDRIAYRRWVADACTPNPGEQAIATIEYGKLHCTIYSNYQRGLAPIVMSAAVMESP